jgi:hypothetical protein
VSLEQPNAWPPTSRQRPTCNGVDRAKDCQESHRLKSTSRYQNVGGNPLERGLPIRQGLGLAWKGSKTGQRDEYGKRSAGKLARSVWDGGKAERPYLSLPVFQVNVRKSARNMGIDHSSPEKAALQAEVCPPFLSIHSNVVRFFELQRDSKSKRNGRSRVFVCTSQQYSGEHHPSLLVSHQRDRRN